MIYEEKCSCNASIKLRSEGLGQYELNAMLDKWRTEHKHETPSPVGGIEDGNNEEST